MGDDGEGLLSDELRAQLGGGDVVALALGRRRAMLLAEEASEEEGSHAAGRAMAAETARPCFATEPEVETESAHASQL